MIENVIAIIAASGGIILVIGSLVLLYQGRITLQAIQDRVHQGQDWQSLWSTGGRVVLQPIKLGK